VSQEQTRFPIQPQDRRRSAASAEDVALAPEELPGPDLADVEHSGDAHHKDQDKPDYPPHERHQYRPQR
jgi:hypothetical protein